MNFSSKESFIPKQAYLYIPSETDIIEYSANDPDEFNRKLFEGSIEYLPFEKEKLKEFYYFTESRGIFFPKGWKKSDSLRFLQAERFDVEKTLVRVKNHLEWRSNVFPIKFTNNIFEILNLGYFYVHGRDHRYRPIVCLDTKVFLKYKDAYSKEEFLNAIIYLSEYVINNLLIEGKVENFDFICDLGYVNLISAPNELKDAMVLLQEHYPCRLFVVYMIRVSSIIVFLWNMFKSFLDINIINKIKILHKDEEDEIFTYINRRQVENKFGGYAPNLTKDFFPPRLISDQYLLPDEIEVEVKKPILPSFDINSNKCINQNIEMENAIPQVNKKNDNNYSQSITINKKNVNPKYIN